MKSKPLKASFAIAHNGFYWQIRPTVNLGIINNHISSMAKNKKKSKQKSAKRIGNLPVETRASESLTVFWTVTVLMALVTDLMSVGVHFYLLSHPDAKNMALLKGMLLFTGALVGGVSLVTLPFLYRVRKVPPPSGLAVFGASVAAAPILAVLLQAIQ